MEWQPIETAPKDGSLFVAWGVTIMDEYDEDDRLIAKGKRHEAPIIAYWFSISGFPGGEFVESPYTRKVMNRKLTHWLPLPAVPACAKSWEGVVA